jgi:LPS export ABC transporter protein LptC/lipopolysaccharide transport protein LptA
MARLRFATFAKLTALILFLGVAALLGFQFVSRFNNNSKPPGPKPPPRLEKQLTGIFDNFHYQHYENNRTQYTLTANKDKVFSDSHHELEKVKLVTYDDKGEVSGQVTSERCYYDQDKSIVRFEQNVVVDTPDGLNVKTELMEYDQVNEFAKTDDPVEFKRNNVHGTCTGAVLESKIHRLEMKQAVHVIMEPEKPEDKAKDDKDKKDDAAKDGAKDKKDNALKDKKDNSDKNKKDKADKKDKTDKQAKKSSANEDKKASAADAKSGGEPANANGNAPVKPVKKLLSDPIDITGNWGEYLGQDRLIKLRGAARIVEPERALSADNITAFISPANKIEHMEARGNSLLESHRSEMPAKVESTEMDFFFDNDGNLTRGEARIDVRGQTLDDGPPRNLTADKLTLFTVQGANNSTEVQHIVASGHVIVKLAAPVPTDDEPNPSAKELRGDDADLFYYSGGKFLREADARGHTILIMTPLNRVVGAEKRTLHADHSNLTFFETDNAAREFNAEGNVKVELEPYAPPPVDPQQAPATRITESEKGKANFDRETGDIDTAVQEGNFRYQEGIKHALSQYALYNADKELFELRVGKVVVWDDQSRTIADEIDLYTEKQESFARGHVRTTYYNPTSTGQSTLFSNMKSPIFVTAKEAHSFNAKGEAIYTGDARAWQDDNFVSGDRLELYNSSHTLVAVGNVSSALYQAAQDAQSDSQPNQPNQPNQGAQKPDAKKNGQGDGGKRDVPVFATSDTMNYSDIERVADYRGNVKMKQGDEDLAAEHVKVFLQKDINEIKRMEAERKVILIQPERRAEGEEAEYTAEDQRTIVTGNLAHAYSQSQGNVTGRRLTLMGGDDRIFADDQRGTRRVRSTHEVKR